MDITIQPGKLSGLINVIPSKSMAHRYLICAAFADNETTLICPETNRDIEATVDCLNALGATITKNVEGYHIIPLKFTPESAVLNCCESGSTLRFLLPIVGALGVNATFQMEGRLPHRPLSPLWEEMERMGCRLKWISENELSIEGKLKSGNYSIDGSISSQFITGLLFAASLMDGDSRIHIRGKLESAPYVAMTQHILAHFGIDTKGIWVRGGQKFRSPGTIIIEGDWSNGAFWLAAQVLGSNVEVQNLSPHSCQGDRAAMDLIPALCANQTVDVSDIPDLVPVLSIVAAANYGAVFTNIQRLRLKESDRVETVIEMIEALGGIARSTEDTLTVWGTGLEGGTVHSHNDHRIAMATAMAATVCKSPVTILRAEAVNKSYPRFWEEYHRLGGNYEQHIR